MSAIPSARLRRQPGMTLIELGLVVVLFGFVMVFVADFFATDIIQTGPPPSEDRRLPIVRDVFRIFEAARRYHAQYDDWPTNDAGEIHIDGLSPDFLDTEIVRNVYAGCGDGADSPCTPYTLKGSKRQGTSGTLTTDPAETDDLVLEFGFPSRINCGQSLTAGSPCDPRSTTLNHPATALASMLPLGTLKPGASGRNEALIEARIHRIRNLPNLRLNGENRIVTFQNGDIREVFELTYRHEDLMTPGQVTGPAIVLMPVGDRADPSTHAAAVDRINMGELPEHEVFIGSNEVAAAPGTYLRMLRPAPPCRPNAVCTTSSANPGRGTRAVFGVNPATGRAHHLVLATTDSDDDSGTADIPSLQLKAFANTADAYVPISASITPLTMQLVPSGARSLSASGVKADDPYWDISLAQDTRCETVQGQRFCHQSLQTRLCALEAHYAASSDDVSVDCSCPGTPSQACRQ